MKIPTLGSFLPMRELGLAATAEATRILERWDVPHEINGQPVAEDIDDRSPRWWRMRDGQRIAGRITPNEIAYGAPSLATPVVLGLIPLLAMLTALLGALLGVVGLVLGSLAIAMVAGTLVIAEGWATAIGAVFVGAVIPLGATIGMAVMPMPAIPHSPGAMGSFMLAGAGSFVLAIFLLSLLLTGSIDRARVAAVYILGFGVVLTLTSVFASLLPRWSAPGVWFLLGAGMPWAWTHLSWINYADRLFVQDNEAPGESGTTADSHALARQQQAEAVMRDQSAVITIGTATGTFSAQGDGFAPDVGKKLCMSAEDSSMHIALFGRTGTRKSSFIRAYVAQWVKHQVGGMLILDEKDLPAELRGLKGYTLIEPGVRYAPLEGLNPTETTSAIFGAGHGEAKSNSSSSQFFETSGKTMWLNGSVLVQALIDVECAALTSEALSDKVKRELASTRRFKWTVSCIRGVISHGVRGDKSIGVMLDSLAHHKRDNEGEQHMLEAAVDYWRTTIPAMDAETKANVFSTLLTWIDPIVSHRDLVAFAHTEFSEGFNLEDICQGGLYGVNLPESQYGMGGLVIASLAKQRVYKLLRERGSKWEDKGQKRVLICVDEAAGLVSDTDVGFLKIARGPGATCLFSVQNADAYVKKLGSQAAAETFIDNFTSTICMESTDYTYQVLSHKLGHVRKQVWKGIPVAVNYLRSLKVLAESALLDASHPAATRAQTLLRRGAGMFREKSDGAHGFAGHQHYQREPSAVDAVLKVRPIERVEWVDAPLLERPEWSSHLAARGVAIAQVLRGGVRRRDVVHFESLRAFPPELLEETDPPKADTPPANESTRTADDLSQDNQKPARRSPVDLDSSVTADESAPFPSTPDSKVKP